MTEHNDRTTGSEAPPPDGEGTEASDQVGRLFEAHADAVLRYCYVALGNLVDAEDAVSETFARLIRTGRRKGLPGVAGDPDRAWLFGIARNVVREHLRHRKRNLVAEPDMNLAEPLQTGIEDLIADREDVAVVREALAGIKPEHRQVILLRFAAGLTAEETGRILGKSPGAVRIQQMRALQALRNSFEGATEGESDG